MEECDMSIIVNIYYTGKDGNAKKFAEEMVSSGVVEAVRAEEGNERYEYFFPMEDPETVLLIDQWTNQEAIDQHHKSEMMSKIAALRDKYKLRLKIQRYQEL
jgi:quinol monooxygenase YgiN